jgi:hypothetical protein
MDAWECSADREPPSWKFTLLLWFCSSGLPLPVMENEEQDGHQGARQPRAFGPSERLRSFSGVHLSVGAFLAGLEQKILHGRPPAVVVVEEHHRDESVTLNGLQVDNLPEGPLDHPEPPDTTGARL